jgi:DNA-binding MarR family transcriptional regulator
MTSDKDSPASGAYTVEQQVGYLLRRAHQRATALFQANIGDPGTTPTQFTSMVKLAEHGELSQNLLGRLVGLDKATTQGVVRRLRDRALIAARPDPTDARRTLLRLTPDGEQVLARLVANGPRVSAETLKPLSDAEQRTLLGLLSRLT